ncbi:MAG: nucleotidyltransferase domain-containing protein [Elusimicrobiota bacterium]
MTEQEIIIEKVKQEILNLGALLTEVEAIGIIGSLASGNFVPEKSDIDILVVLDDLPKESWEEGGKALNWTYRIQNLLSKKCDRRVTVIITCIEFLIDISDWYVFSFASDSILIYDKGKVKKIFDKIMEKTKEWGLVQKQYETYGHKLWGLNRPLNPGEILDFHLEEKELDFLTEKDVK